MPLAALLVPPALLAAAAALGWGLWRGGVDAGRPAAAIASWLAALVVAGAWFAGRRTPFEVATPITAGVAPLALRMDAVVVVFQLVVLTGAALLLTFQRRSAPEAAAAALAVAVAVATLAAGSVVLSAFGLASCASLVLALLRHEDEKAARQCWVSLTGAWLLLAWTAVVLEVGGGTTVYGAVPVTALQVPVFLLLALAAVLFAGLLPWRTWVSEVWTRPRLPAGTLAVALLVPLGLSPLARAYGLGAGHWPSPWLNVAMAALGAATTLGAAIRAQAASSRRGFLAEAVPMSAGMVLLAFGLGTPLGLVAGVTGLAGLGLVAGLAPLVPVRRGALAVLTLGTVAGAPPTVVFGGWLLSVQGALEAGMGTAFLGLAAAAAWLLGLAAAARALRLPPLPPEGGRQPADDEEGSVRGAVAAAAAAVVAGVALTALVALLAIPAAAQVMPAGGGAPGAPGVSAAAILTPGSLGISTASGGWSAALLAGPLAAIALAVAILAHLARRGDGEEPAGLVVIEPPPPPLFAPPLAGVPERVIAGMSGLRLPEQYRSLFRPALLEQAATHNRPWLWALATVVLAIAVTR